MGSAASPRPTVANPSTLWSGYLIGCGRDSKQERALSSSGGSGRSFSVRAGAVRAAAEPENVRQPHVLLETHGGEGGELEPCAGSADGKAGANLPARVPIACPALPCLQLPRRAASHLRHSFAGRSLGAQGCSLPCQGPRRPQQLPSPMSWGPWPQALRGATAPDGAT